MDAIYQSDVNSQVEPARPAEFRPLELGDLQDLDFDLSLTGFSDDELAELTLEDEEKAREQLSDKKRRAFDALGALEKVALEETAMARMLEECQGLRPLVKKDDGVDPRAPVEERYKGLSNSIVREAFDKQFERLLLELAGE